MIDKSVKRVLTQKFRIGLFENPYVDADKADKINNSNQHRALALNLARKTAVLLKNDNNVLPFSKDVKKVAVLGPMGNWLLINHYGGWGRHEVTVLEGIKKLLPNAEVTYEKGAEMEFVSYPAIQPENFIGGLKAEYFDNANLSGTPKYIRTWRS
jgi:beta-glucosidase